MTCQLPEEKLETIKDLSFCRDILANSRMMVRGIQRLMGCVISSRPAVPLTRARCKGIQERVLKHYKGTVASAKKQV